MRFIGNRCGRLLIMFRLHHCITLAILFLNVSSSPHHHRSRHSHPRAKPSEILPDRYGKFVDEFNDRYGKSMEDKYDHSVEENGKKLLSEVKSKNIEVPGAHWAVGRSGSYCLI